MVTGREIYERAIALIDEISPDTGLVEVDTTEDYLARAPYLLTLLQTELMPYSKTRKKFLIAADGSAGNVWLKAHLPDDVLSIEDVIVVDSRYYHDPAWKTERDGNVIEFYYHGTFKGTLKIIYTPIPSPVTDLDNFLTVDDVTANLMAYGLAESFINVEQNDFLQRIFKAKYDEQKMLALKPTPAGAVKIVDVYGGI